MYEKQGVQAAHDHSPYTTQNPDYVQNTIINRQ